MKVTTINQAREVYRKPQQLPQGLVLDVHVLSILAQSSFLVAGTTAQCYTYITSW